MALLEYTFKYTLRYKYKNLFIFTVMTLLVALVAATLFIADAMKTEYSSLIQTYPDITLTAQKALKESSSDEKIIDAIFEINGVSNVVGRVWGEYYFEKGKKKFTIVGVDEFENYANPLFNRVSASEKLQGKSMLLSKGVKRSLEKNYYREYFNFIQADGVLKRVAITGTFEGNNSFENEDLIVMPKELARDIFDYNSSEVTDIAITVTNKAEVGFIALKLADLFPQMKIEIKEDFLHHYEEIYNNRSGFFLTVFIITFFTFFIIIYDKMSGLSSEQKKEIGILKALGWRVEDVLNAKLYEGLLISLSAYFTGILLAYIYVYVFDAYYLKNIFLNNYTLLDSYKLEFTLHYDTLALIFFLSVPIYIAATIIPAWMVATTDADEVMR